MGNPWLEIPLEAKRLKQLQLICADIQSKELHFEPVDLIYAALIFEYADVLPTIATLKRLCRGGGTLATVLQLPSSHQSAVSPSPYESLSRLAGFMSLVAPSNLSEIAVAAGFTPATSDIIELPSEKSFWVQTYRLETKTSRAERILGHARTYEGDV
jgi:hypothetical protein